MTRKAVLLLPAIFLGAWFNAGGQLASVQLDGLQIRVASIYRSGDSRDLDCSIGLKFTGEKADRAVSMSPVKIIQAVDDTGRDLLRTNKSAFHPTDFPPTKSALWFWQTVDGLKAPAPNAKTIRHLEAKVQFFTPTASTPVLKHFQSRPGEILHQATLDKYQVQIRCLRTRSSPPGSSTGSPEKTITLKVDDPQNKLATMAFQTADGHILPATRLIREVNGTQTELTYGFSEVPPPDLNLVVYVAAPAATDQVRFDFENIRLPWVDVPDLEVSAEALAKFPAHATNPYTCNLLVNFTGGPLNDALGIRTLWITNATDDAGNQIKVRNDQLANVAWPWRFDAVPPAMGDGRNVQKLVPLVFQSRDPKVIRLLAGEAELIRSSAINSGLVAIKDFMNHAGEAFDLPVLKANHVKLAYLGPVNYAAKRQEFISTNYMVEHGGLLPAEVPSDKNNAVQFSLEDPDQVVIAPWGGEEINFLDEQGRSLPAVSVMTSGKFRVYRFQTLPPPGTQLAVQLAIPESLQHIPFKIENITLH